MASVELLWKLPPSGITPAADEVSVWCVELDQPTFYTDNAFQCLSQEEQNRASQFKIDLLRCRYIVGRAILRRLLGDILKIDPSMIEFKYGSRGKPELAGESAGQLHFNVSHSAGLALIGVTVIGPLGVDLEEIRSLRYDMEIAKRFFTPNESAKLGSLAVANRPSAFFNLWTRKEAWLKARGVGIAESLSQVDISCLPGELVRVNEVVNQPKEAEQWTLAHLTPADGFTGALAIRAPAARISCWRFPG